MSICLSRPRQKLKEKTTLASNTLGRNPFDIPEPLLIGMSGGQTSAYQLRRFLDHLGGKITGRRAVCFANTGDEDERTLKFVERVSLEWDVSVVWLEYRFVPFPQELLADPSFRELRQRQFANRKDKQLREELALLLKDAGFLEQAIAIAMGRECLNGRHAYEIVNYATASRNKEPYTTMMESRESYRQYVKGLAAVLPNASQRICTGELKMNTMRRFVYDLWGIDRPEAYNVALALRADEWTRVAAAQERKIEAGVSYFPLFDSGVRAADVVEFWRNQPFQLGMRAYEGNCKLCHMKKSSALDILIRRNPAAADWWIGWESRANDYFRRSRESYKAMKWQAEHQPLLFDEPDELETVITCESGYCSN